MMVKRIILLAVLAGILIFGGVQLFYLFYYRLFAGYKSYLTEYSIEPGRPFSALPDSGEGIPGMLLAAENEYLKLYINRATAETAVLDKRTGEVFFSNPPDGRNDPIASSINLEFLQSQLLVEFFNARRALGTKSSYRFSTSIGQVELEAIENGVRFTYTIGDFELPTGILPLFISEERLLEVTERMGEEGRMFTTMRYLPWPEREGFMFLPDGAQGPATVRRLLAFFEEAGYTYYDFEYDMYAAGAEDFLPLSFVIPLEYRLCGASLVVSIPAAGIEEHGGGMISRIQLLRMFGAGGVDCEGYILVPNGSGSLIHFNNGRTRAESYVQHVFGIDPMIMEFTLIENTERARLPIFGIVRNGAGVFAEIERGASLSLLTAFVSGNVNSYNFVFPTFILRGLERLATFGATDAEAEFPILEREIYDVNFTVRYHFMLPEYASYSGMANFYRELLVREGRLPPAHGQTGDIPLYLDIIGGTLGTGFFLGAQYLRTVVATTFEQAGDIAEILADDGVGNITVNLQGWFNRGFYHDVPDRVRVIRGLGGKGGLEKLGARIETLGGRLFGEIGLQEVPFSSRRYNFRMENSRYYGAGFVAAFGRKDPTTLAQVASFGHQDVPYNLISPKFLPRYVDRLNRNMERQQLPIGMSLRDLGNTLHSDKRRTEVINRDMAQDIVTAQFAKLTRRGPVMTSGGNSYSLAFTSDIINIPLSHNPFFIIDEEVPFFQMVVRGHIDYAGAPLNITGRLDMDEAILRMIEFGASPRFTVTWESSNVFRNTGLMPMYATKFENWREEIVRVYSAVNNVLKYTEGSPIVRHEILAAGVRRVVYENGAVITVNYTDTPFFIDGITVPARGYYRGVAS